MIFASEVYYTACQAVAVTLHRMTNDVKYNDRGKSLQMTRFYRLIFVWLQAHLSRQNNFTDVDKLI